MRNTTIREKLYDYIRFADDKKVKAIYTMVEEDIIAKTNPWDDPAFIDELDRRVAEYESGNIKMSTWEEVKSKARGLKT
jgi:putative addiction module component (TIGR02574 family)